MPTHLLIRALSLLDEEPTIRNVVLTGGDPFLRTDLIRTAVSYCAARGAAVSVMTAAYWATTETAAYKALQDIDGAVRLIISIDRYHYECMPRERVLRAIRAASTSSIKEIILQVTLAAFGDSLELEEMLLPFAGFTGTVGPALGYSINNLVPSGRGNTLPVFRTLPAHGFDRPCLAVNGLSARANGDVHGCCGPIGFAVLDHQDPLFLGNLQRQTWDEIRASFRSSKLVYLLRTLGPYQAFQIIEATAGGTAFEEREYTDICDLCCHLFGDPANWKSLQSVLGRQSAAVAQDPSDFDCRK